jgi:hypothetical protein
MANIHVLRGNSYVRSVRLDKRRLHDVWVKVTDTADPTLTRWIVQRAINRARGCKANKGFTDASVAAGKWHHLEVRPKFLSRFAVRDLGALIAAELIRVEIDGEELEARRLAS